MKRFVIGDIHGCYEELMELLDRAGLCSDDEIIGIGDIVDRGPDTPKVLEFFRSNPQRYSLMGNHERKHIRSFRREIPPSTSQIISRQQFGEDYPAAVAAMSRFLYFLELDEAILVHGYLDPNLPLIEQEIAVVCGTLAGGRHLVRKYGAGTWYESYHGTKPLIVGHKHYLGNNQPLIWRDKVYGIDTGCCRGGALTGLLLPDFTFFSVPSRANHWETLQKQFSIATKGHETRRRAATA